MEAARRVCREKEFQGSWDPNGRKEVVRVEGKIMREKRVCRVLNEVMGSLCLLNKV